MRTKRHRLIGDMPAAVRLAQNTTEEDMRTLLGQIHGFYEAALDWLPAEEIPSLAPRLLSAGLCIGVLDPVSNIISNTVAYCPSSNPKDEEEEGEKEEAVELHTRGSVMSRIITDIDDNDFPLLRVMAKPMSVARRSLEGLVSFLVSYVRYLAITEALRYLRLAGADLLAAVQLIERDRSNSIDPENRKFGFSVVSLTTKLSMGCAAISARHPDKYTLLRTSQLLAARLDKASMYLPVQNNGSHNYTNLKHLRRLLKQEPKPVELRDPCYCQPLQLAALRYLDAKMKVEDLPSSASAESTEPRGEKRKVKKRRPGYFAECMKQLKKRIRKAKRLSSRDSAECTQLRKKRKVKKLSSGDSAEFTLLRKKRKVRRLPSGDSAERMEQRKKTMVNVTYRYTQTLKLLLLDKIHVHYLEALARLPGDALRNSYHVGLLRAGFCYGPMDPVSNIIINSVWYAITFPTHTDFEVGFEVAMISTNILRRIECGSLYGLVAFLRALFNTLTEHDALWFLLVSNIDAALAIKMVEEQGHVMSGAYNNAYMNAAHDSWHPDPDELLKLVMPLVSTSSGERPSWMNNGAPLLLEKFVMSLSPKCEEQASQLNQEKILSGHQKSFMLEIRRKFRADQEFFVKKAKNALNTYAQKNGVSTLSFCPFFLFFCF
jgi:hypothetical protein